MSALIEARESLTYWESRLHRLPRYAVRRRREARAMCVRWRERVSQAELAEYGPGFLGAVFQLMAERRLPTNAYARGRQAVKVGLGVVAAVTVTTMALVALVLGTVVSAVL